MGAMSHDAHDPGTVGPTGPGRPGASVVPGWYPDRATPGVERWWDGTTWGAPTRPPEGLARPLPPLVLKNAPATAGMWLGIASLVVNTFLVTSLAAIVLSALGLTRASRFTTAGYAPVGRTKAVLGLILAVLGAGGTVAFKALLF